MIKREIDVRKQKQLSLQSSCHFCFKGIVHRLFRSSLTLAVVLLAVALFMALLTESVLLRSTSKGVEQEIRIEREAGITLAFLYSSPSKTAHAFKLSEIIDNEPKLNEYARISGFAIADIKGLAANACQEQIYLEFFDNMSIGKRRILVKKIRAKIFFFI